MTPAEAYRHCQEHGRNSELEKIIATDPKLAFYYALHVIKSRWIEAEKIIINNPGWAYYYARDIIKGRWIEGENVIATDPEIAYYYAREVIKGKLPENMHNAMIAHGIINPKDKNIKTYLKSKKYKTKQPV